MQGQPALKAPASHEGLWLYESIGEIGARIRARAVSPVEIVEACLERIAALNPRLNAFITIVADDALEQARRADAEIRAGGWRGPLHGVPVGVKDLFDTAGVRTTAAFEHFRNRVPAKDAVAVGKLKAAGAIVVGKTNMHRLAMGTTSAISDFGAVRNPWNVEAIAGGSSGGSAAAVAAGMCYATLDTDAIGSCRLPASCCGVTGFKGTYGLVSLKGVLEGEEADPAILWLAHAAVTTRSVEDAALMLNALAEPHAGSPPISDDFVASGQDEKLRIGIVANFSASAEVSAAFAAAVEVLRGFGRTRTVDAPFDNPGFDVSAIEADRLAMAASLFREADVLVLPTTAATTPAIADAFADPMKLSPQNTLFANYYGLPAISTPCGFDKSGLPLGLQIVGKPGRESDVLGLARRYQHATAWADMHPIEEPARV
jgi:aspartyl-tRNA(Asn)/glutamyl-tRNA(Gln) amidotransferase subunit A